MLLNVLDARDRPTQDSFFSEELMGDADSECTPGGSDTYRLCDLRQVASLL